MPLLIFSSRLEQLMKPENISKRKLSIESHVDRASITTYLQGSCLPRYEALARIADYFEVSADYLLGLEEENIYCYHTVCEIEEIPDLFICRLKELMREKGFSQGKLAEKIKMQQASISKWIRKRAMPETFALMDLATKAFDCKVDYLIGREINSNIKDISG